MSRDSERTALCKLLRHPIQLPSNEHWPGLVARANTEGIAPLIYSKLKASALWSALPADVQKPLQAANATLAAKEFLRHQEAILHLNNFEREGLAPITIKGAALAYTHYDAPHHRPRADTDILFRNQQQAELAANLLEAHGYKRAALHDGDLMNKAFTLFKLDDSGVLEHQYDLHWRVAYEHRYQQVLSYDKLLPLSTRNGYGYRTPDPVISLLITCIHNESDRPKHAHNRLIWYVDLKLLTNSFTIHDWVSLTEFAALLHAGDAIINILDPASNCLQMSLPHGLKHQLQQSGNEGTINNFHSVAPVIRNLRYLSLRQKIRYVWQLFFPSITSIKSQYKVNKPREIFFAYARRIVDRLKLYLTKK